jgi:NodT family efflux transporter outer membrane factor (OMF) lipoprotein
VIHPFRNLRTALATSLFLTAAGCFTVGPDYEAPTPEAPTEFREQNEALTSESADLSTWWRNFDDALLDDLIARATRQNLDLEEAMARIAEARALRGVAAAEQYPSLDLRAAYERRHDSENTPFGAFAVDWDRHTVGLDASWELDLWGRVRRSVEAADADLMGTIEAARAVLVTIAAETASTYVELRSLQQRLAIARNTIALQQQTLDLVRARFDSGLVGERDVAQARRSVSTTSSRVPTLEAQLRAAENRLAVLLGRAPGAPAAELSDVRPIPTPPVSVAVGVPADIVRRRPDIRAAERELAAATARIGVAKGDLYPKLTLFGTVGFEADDASDLFESSSNILNVGPALSWNIFDAGALHRRVAAQDARAQQVFARWERSVLIGIEEAENAMTAFVREQARRSHLADATNDAQRAVDLARTQYTEGLTDFQNVLDSQRATAELEDQLAESSAAIGTNLIALYKALGGGWQVN